jgi:uncharacterized protein YcaQ
MHPPRLSAARARRLALGAQGLAAPRPSGRVDRRHVRRVFDRVGVIQIDSVNVLVRSQELPLFSRLGPHPRDVLPRMASDGELFEYWAHEASLLPVALHPYLRFAMRAARYDGAAYQRLVTLQRERPEFVEAVYEQVAERGPLAASDLGERRGRSGPWWGWDDGKQALEFLFWCGRISARRRGNFERVYDLPERMLPPAVVAAPTPTEADARKALIVRAARSLGVATAEDLADYHRQRLPKVRPLLPELVEDGALVPVEVEGWVKPAYLDPDATVPRRVDARALLSPFDSLVWERARTERVFGFRYRLEIYVPPPQRVFGYYVLPFLLGDQLVARVDLKADRGRSALLVRGAFAEPAHDLDEVAGPLLEELHIMAGWLGLERVRLTDVGPDGLDRPSRGDLVPALSRGLTRAGGTPG